MTQFSRQTPDGRTIAAEPDLRRHIASPPERNPAEAVADRRDGSALTLFVAGSIAALPELPKDSGSRLCLQLFFIGAGSAFWHAHSLDTDGFIPVVRRLLERHGLPGSETAALIEALPELREDSSAKYILDQGAQAMLEHMRSHDRNLALRMQQRVSDWRRERICRQGPPRTAHRQAPSR
jgi:hypothetical protein